MNIPADSLKAKQHSCLIRCDAAKGSAQVAYHATSLAIGRWKNAVNIHETLSAGIELLRAQNEYSRLLKKAHVLHHLSNIYKTLSRV